MNTYLYVGSQAIGALSLADRIEDRDPEQQAKLRQVGLRSSFENWLFQSHEHPILFSPQKALWKCCWLSGAPRSERFGAGPFRQL